MITTRVAVPNSASSDEPLMVDPAIPHPRMGERSTRPIAPPFQSAIFPILTALMGPATPSLLRARRDVTELAQRLIEAAKGQGISEADLQAEIGDIVDYVRGKLKAANKAESNRYRPS